MYAASAFTLLGLASGAVATFSPSALNKVRELHEVHIVEVRDDSDGTDGAGCTSSALSILGAAPSAPSDLVDYLSSWAVTATATDTAALCQITDNLPESLKSEYSSYDSAASSWFSEYSDDIEGLVTACASDDMGDMITSALSSIEESTGVCSGAAMATQTSDAGNSSKTTGANGSSRTTDANGSSNTSGTNSPTTGGAARPTGLVAGAAGAAAFLGLAVAL